MKKNIITLLILFSSAFLFAKNLSPEEVKYQEVLEFPGIEADVLFEKAKQSFVNQCHSAKDVIQYSNKEEGKFIGKAWMDVTYSLTPVRTWFVITVDVKNEKMRITFTDMRMPGVFSNKEDETLFTLKMQLDKFSVKAKKIVETMQKDILAKVEDDDW